MPKKLGNGGEGLEEFNPNDGQYIEDGVPNKSYDNPEENKILNSMGIDQSDKIEKEIFIPQKPKRVKLENYFNSNGEIDYEKLEKDREEYRKKMDIYEKQKEEIINSVYYRERTFNTLEEFKQWVKQKDYILGNNIEKIELKCLLDFADINDKLLKKYPIVEKYRKNKNGKYKIDFDEINDYMASATSIDGFLGFTFGKSSIDYKNFIKRDLENREENWCVKGNGNIKSLYTHEFGHDLYNSIVSPFYKSYPFLVKEFEKDIINSLWNKNGISDYAKTNVEELFCEAFAEYELGNSEFGKNLYGVIERWLKNDIK